MLWTIRTLTTNALLSGLSTKSRRNWPNWTKTHQLLRLLWAKCNQSLFNLSCLWIWKYIFKTLSECIFHRSLTIAIVKGPEDKNNSNKIRKIVEPWTNFSNRLNCLLSVRRVSSLDKKSSSVGGLLPSISSVKRSSNLTLILWSLVGGGLLSLYWSRFFSLNWDNMSSKSVILRFFRKSCTSCL